ncbi:MAG: preprotein translocase subunit SecA [Candidatus Dormibacteria bacterium]
MSLLRRVIDPTGRELRRHASVVEQINQLEDGLKKLSDTELRARTAEFRERLGVTATDLSYGQSASGSVVERDEQDEEADILRREQEERVAEQRRLLDELLPEAFAVVREAARRALGMRHYDVQLVGGIVLHNGRIAEMRTGEGKTLVATLALYLNALQARGAHLVTVNDYLARRDAGWNGPLYHALGMSVAVIASDMSLIFDPDFLDQSHPDPRLQHLRPCSRREAYAADITYATNNELGFDYLRDNMALSLEQCNQRHLHYAIVDEVDSILIDEARTPLIISGQGEEPTEKYYTYARLIPQLNADTDYSIDEKTRTAALTDEGIAKIEKWTGIGNVYDIEHVSEAHQINQALTAHAILRRDKDYIVRDGEVIIIDEFTGRALPGRRWSDGRHAAVEAKEGVRVQQENVTLATITFQNFFRLYTKLAGMTGTAITEAEEFSKIYKLDVVPIPTNQPNQRLDEPDLVFQSEEAKYKAIAEEIEERHAKQQPVLVGTTSIENSERLARMLEKRGVPHEVLNAKFHENEAQIVAGAGQPGAVTIATNMAGRGTDIVLGPGVTGLGGLYIVGTERHESRRIDNQLRGRSGRQGDPGETRFFLSFEDELMRRFGGERMQSIMSMLRIDADTPLESKRVTKQMEGAQSRVEGYNFDSRRQVVEYDDVMNKQREVIYGERRKILEGSDTRHNLLQMISHVVRAEVPGYCEGRHRESWDLEGLWERMRTVAPLPALEEVDLESLGSSIDEIGETLTEELTGILETKERHYGGELMRGVEQSVMLQIIDQKWRAYLTQMDHLREGIGLQSYGQKDPLLEYKTEAFSSFQELTEEIQQEIVRVLMHITITPVEQPGAAVAPATEAMVADPGGRADLPGESELAEDQPPAARPAAAAASAALARATARSGRSLVPQVRAGNVSNVMESSATGTQRAATATAQRANAVPAGASTAKVGRNDPCPCGSGKKYKRCHGV